MTISIKPTASGSTIEQDGSTILTVDGSGNIIPSNNLYPKAPAFSVYRTSDQTVTGGVITKIAFETEEYDTNSNYDNSTNYRFTPTVAGYYQINAQVSIYQPSTDAGIFIYKNGSAHKWGDYFTRASGYSADVDVAVSSLVYLNGSTDYVEIYGYGVGTTKFYGANSFVGRTYFNGVLVSV